jgi:predicted transcriptional regulator of viral defense system
VNLYEFLKSKVQGEGRFTVKELVEVLGSAVPENLDNVLEQLERWGYIKRMGDGEYTVVREKFAFDVGCG